ncbi:MAG: hypothetical protein NTW03_16230, partial [Verrucomicrobia bacterium]|nr:hypothetical protein [Verrucomicrobiota bacterium]
KHHKHSTPNPSPPTRPALVQVCGGSFFEEGRGILVPEKKWHYLFHGVVILVALFYWIGSRVKLPAASWAEIAMYRPLGDNQVWPIITALSQLNFGDPTDAMTYGKGLGNFQVVILFPYALACAVFGTAGYMVADGVLSWLYFLGVTLLLRRCNFGHFTSLVAGSALATCSLQTLSGKVAEIFSKLMAFLGVPLTEWGFPNLLSLQIFEKRIPRPMVTEVLVVFVLYLLLKQWQQRRWPSLKGGLAVGGLLALLAQGDPFSLSSLGLLLLAVMARTLERNRWQVPWRLVAGLAAGALVFGWYFLVQRIFEEPDSAIRFGVGAYPRSKLVLLPGYAPLLRVGVVGLLAWLLALAARAPKAANGLAGRPERKHEPGCNPAAWMPGGPTSLRAEPTAAAPLHPGCAPVETSIAQFCVALIVAAWLAQPIQLLLLGKGAQIYHYSMYTLPCFYSYALLILLFNSLKRARSMESSSSGLTFVRGSSWAGAVLVALGLLLEVAAGIAGPLDAIMSLRTSRQEISPWATLGNRYRADFRALDKEFRDNPVLRQTRTFACLAQEVNFLLTAFHGKRAYLPDNAYTTLKDAELERRLCQMGKLLKLSPATFRPFIRNEIVMNYWLGCCKYWCSSDRKFSSDSDYTPEQLDYLKRMPGLALLNLVLPQSEIKRLSNKYVSILTENSDRAAYPDVIILTEVLTDQAVVPDPTLYRQFFTNDIFAVYTKIQ